MDAKDKVDEIVTKLHKHAGLKDVPSIQLEKCVEHAKQGHTPFDSSCLDCCRANMRTNQHKRRKFADETESRIDFDISVYSREGPYAACARATAKDGRPVFLARRLADKSTNEIRIALESMMIEAQVKWNCSIFTRVHSDREGGLGALKLELQKVGIYSTQTQGYDPAANGLAENAVAKIGAVARANLSRLATDATGDTLRALGPFAM